MRELYVELHGARGWTTPAERVAVLGAPEMLDLLTQDGYSITRGAVNNALPRLDRELLPILLEEETTGEVLPLARRG
jgi:hypothetical protein